MVLWLNNFTFLVELPTADPSQARSREKRQFEGLDSSSDSSDDSETDSSGDNTDDDSSDNTIKVKMTKNLQFR